jgi:hypothetical protein
MLLASISLRKALIGDDKPWLSLLGRYPEWVVIDRWEDAQFHIPVYVS